MTTHTFKAIFLGVLPDMDPIENSTVAENTGILTGMTVGSSGDSVAGNHLSDLSLVDANNNLAVTNNNPTSPAAESLIYDGTSSVIDTTLYVTVEITYTDGTIGNTFMVVWQDVSGRAFLAPSSGTSPDNDALNLKPIESIQIVAPLTSYNGFAFVGFDANEFVTCFTSGTLIKTKSGEVTVEDLEVGDMVLTIDNGYQPIRWIGSNRMSLDALHRNEKLRPIHISAGALGNGMPQTDLLVSPQHRVLVNSAIAQRMFGESEVLVAAKQLVEIDGINIAEDNDNVEYFHILFDRHELVISNGATTESLFTGPQALISVSPQAREEILTIFPELSDINYDALSCRPLVKGSQGRQLAMRHQKNNTQLVQSQHH